MTKMKNMIVLIITVIIAAAFASCSNPVSPLYSTEALMEEAVVEDNSAAAEAADSDMPKPAADDQNEDSDSSPVDEPIVKMDPSESKYADSIDSTDDGTGDNEPAGVNEPTDNEPTDNEPTDNEPADDNVADDNVADDNVADDNVADDNDADDDDADDDDADDDDAEESSDRSNGNRNKGPGNNNGQGKDQGNHYGWYK